MVLSHLMSDRRIARAAHPIINAWRCSVGGVLHQDNDDDGESAAGGRLAHLLQIMEVNDVLVIVTRYFGGIHLGPDRFKCVLPALRGGTLTIKCLDISIKLPEQHLKRVNFWNRMIPKRLRNQKASEKSSLKFEGFKEFSSNTQG